MEAKLTVGSRVRRDPKVWSDEQYGKSRNVGTIVGQISTNAVPGEMAYRVVMDADADGIMNFFTGLKEPATGIYYLESELELIESQTVI